MAIRVHRKLVLAICWWLSVACLSCSRTTSPKGFEPGILQASQVDQEPRLLSCSLYKPPRSSGSSVAVEVEFIVTLDGWVQNPRVLSQGPSRYSKRIRDSAIWKAQSCRFSPGKKDGIPVMVRTSMWFRWGGGSLR